MDGDGVLKNWGYYEPPMKQNHLNLQLMTSMAERKPLIGSYRSPLLGSSNGSGYHSRDIQSSHYPVDFPGETWIHRDTSNNSNTYLMPTNHGYSFPMENTSPNNHHHPLQMIRQLESSNEEWMIRAEPATDEINNGPQKKRSAGKSDKGPKMKKPKKGPIGSREGGTIASQRGSKAAKKTTSDVVINGIDMDISSIPIPVCSCTGTPQQCYRWGFGGWQSACCTTGMSMYPLPMSPKRRGARIAGRKMSLGAFKKVLEKLATEGYNFSNPIDLRSHWAKHGTNKFVTIK